jgi:hypothetical protein
MGKQAAEGGGGDPPSMAAVGAAAAAALELRKRMIVGGIPPSELVSAIPSPPALPRDCTWAGASTGLGPGYGLFLFWCENW